MISPMKQTFIAAMGFIQPVAPLEYIVVSSDKRLADEYRTFPMKDGLLGAAFAGFITIDGYEEGKQDAKNAMAKLRAKGIDCWLLSCKRSKEVIDVLKAVTA